MRVFENAYIKIYWDILHNEQLLFRLFISGKDWVDTRSIETEKESEAAAAIAASREAVTKRIQSHQEKKYLEDNKKA